MKNFRSIIIAISVVLILIALLFIDYQDLVSRSNLGSFLGIISMLFNILAMILSIRYDAKNKNTWPLDELLKDNFYNMIKKNGTKT